MPYQGHLFFSCLPAFGGVARFQPTVEAALGLRAFGLVFGLCFFRLILGMESLMLLGALAARDMRSLPA